MNNPLKTVTINELLPSSLQDDAIINALATALSDELQKITNSIDKILIYPNIKELDEEIIDLLAEQFQVSFYDVLGLNLETKRELVQNAIIYNKQKGTKAVIEDMLSILYSSKATVQEWFEFGGEPFTFKISIDNINFSENDYLTIMDILDTLKNVRSHLANIVVKLTSKTTLKIGSVLVEKIQTKIKTGTIEKSKTTNYIGNIVIIKRKTVVKGSEFIG